MRKSIVLAIVLLVVMSMLPSASASVYEETRKIVDECNVNYQSMGWFLNGERINVYVYNDAKISEVFFIRVISGKICFYIYNNDRTMDVMIFDGDKIEEILESQDLYGLCNAVNKNWIQFKAYNLITLSKIKLIKTYCWWHRS